MSTLIKSKTQQKYLLITLIALFILLIQFILAFSFYSYKFDDAFHILSKLNKLTSKPILQNVNKIQVETDLFDKYKDKYVFSNQNNLTKMSSFESLSSLDFKLNCDLKNKDALFALKRALTRKCKQKIADIACSIQNQSFYPKTLPNYCPYQEITKKKPFFKNNHIAQNVKIVFLLTLNGRSFRQVKRLIKNIYSAKHFYYIHVDKRHNYLYNQLLRLEKFANVKLFTNRMSTIWGGSSLLKILLKALEELLILIPDWDYVINLSESDFPIKPIKMLETFLSDNKEYIFVKFHGIENSKFIYKQGLDKTFVECENRMWKVGDRKLPEGIYIDGGSDWVILTRKFSEYVVNKKNSLLEGLKTFYNYTLLPAESFFHTVIRNSEFCSSVINTNLHYTNWNRKRGCKCQQRHVVDWCGCSPNVLKHEDWPHLLKTKSLPVFFARKFEPVVDQWIINKVESMIDGKDKNEMTSWKKYWQNDYHFLDLNINGSQLSFYYILSLLSLETIDQMCGEAVMLRNIDFDFYLSQIKVEFASLYFENDIYSGTLIAFSYRFKETNLSSSFEIYARQNNYFQIYEAIGPTNRLINIQVCNDLDLKEQIFRNFGCVLGPFSQLIFRHKWVPKKENFTITIIWIDPSNIVAGSFKVNVNYTQDKVINGQLILYHKPYFNLPLRSGTWRVFLFYNWTKIAETRFLIIPLIFHTDNSQFLNMNQLKHYNNGPENFKYTNFEYSKIKNLLNLSQNKVNQPVFSHINEKNFKKDFVKWSIDLVDDFWKIQSICLSNLTFFKCLENTFEQCKKTNWSSFSSDPKSNLSLLNQSV